ncbi:predicted protein [Naegleria gruberi]|uniref:Predicted protein n=1 Tax=Naegleria gruberi TaxID=5762 RepID=D2UXU4_NAEGR|nr:uncharacterized protein NAEGRDRAFT_61244 [Naegleria gruberi]EFC50349.1 predicted protein [Naegleria gruberi]|eukprot:XP_002683093.1 predicted protein [Naegleria gruberi strain NEG-M]
MSSQTLNVQALSEQTKEESPMKSFPRFRPFLKSEVESSGDDKPKCCAAFHKGHNCTLFALGAHQSGKTYTLFGNVAKSANWATELENQKFDGIAPRFIRAVFDFIMNQSPENIEFSVSLNAFEICGLENGNDALMNDLLANTSTPPKLDVLVEEETNAVEIVGLQEVFVTSDSELFENISGALMKRSKKFSTAFFEIKFVQHDTSTNLTKEGRLCIIDLDSERSSDQYRNTRKTGCKVFQEVAESLYTEVEDYDYFSTTLKCLVFSRVFVNTATFSFVTLSPMISVVEDQTIPYLQLASKICELSSDVMVNYVQDPIVETPQEEEKSIPTPHPVASVQANAKVEAVQQEELAKPIGNPTSLPTTNEKKEIPTILDIPPKPTQSITDVTKSEEYMQILKEKINIEEDILLLRTQFNSLKDQLEREEEKASKFEKEASLKDSATKELAKQLKESFALTEQLQKERDRYEEQVKASQNDIQQLKEKLIHEESIRDELNEKAHEQEKTLANYRSSEEQMTIQITQLKKELQEFKQSSNTNHGSIPTPLKNKGEELEKEVVLLIKSQHEELKNAYNELSIKIVELEKKNIYLEEELVDAEKKALEADDPSHQLIEKLKSKNKLLLEQLNLSKRENLKSREKSVEINMKLIEQKIQEYQQLVNQSSTVLPTPLNDTTVTVNNEDLEPISPQEKLNVQKLKEKVTDLTNKLTTARKKATETEIARMKWQEGEKATRQKISDLENEIEELKQKMTAKESSLKEEIDQLQKEINSWRETDQKIKSELKKIEKEKQSLEQVIKKENVNRKKSVMVMHQVQQVQESNNLILRNELAQARERIEYLERELKKIGGPGMKISSRSQTISPSSRSPMTPTSESSSQSLPTTAPKKLDDNSQKDLRQKEIQSKRQSVLINKNAMQALRVNIQTEKPKQEISSPTEDIHDDADEEEYGKQFASNTYDPHQANETTMSENVNPKIDKSGYLFKKGPKINIFKKRFFKIEGHNLIYQTDSKDSKALGSIDLRTALTDIAPEKSSNKRKYVFRVEIPGRTYFMSAPSKEDRDEWVISLRHVIQKLSNENSF